jgi:hypothetical protein
LLRPLLTVSALIAIYYALPLDRVDEPQLLLVLVAGMLAIAGLPCGAGTGHPTCPLSRHPAVQGVEALAAAVPLFLLLFAAVYWVLAGGAPDAFTQPMSRTDALHFTATVFATVEFAPMTERPGSS